MQKVGLFVCGCGVSFASVNLYHRLHKTVKGKDSFAEHTRSQHDKHFISGMHEPFIPSKEQHQRMSKHFALYSHMLPISLEDNTFKRAIKTPVRIRPLKECPSQNEEIKTSGLVVVGGAPALLSTAFEENITYINDQRQIPIAMGSAWHLEWDSPSEKPTSIQPIQFMKDQIRRVIFPFTIADAEKTGCFPWRSLDWVGWITHPEKWIEGIRLAYHFQLATTQAPDLRKRIDDDCAGRTKSNEKFFLSLDNEITSGEPLLLPNKMGSIIVARTEDEVLSLVSLKNTLMEEKRNLTIQSKENMISRFGFVPRCRMIGEKTHDRILSPNFMSILSNRIVSQKKGSVVNGAVLTVYTDNPNEGGIVEYTNNGLDSGASSFIGFDRLVMSLGNQRIYNESDSPMLDIVAARGISALAVIYLPEDKRLPAATVCGDTNHVTSIAGPSPMVHPSDGKTYNSYLVKLTCSACITPNVEGDVRAAHYDSVAATGLVTAVRRTLGFPVEVLTVWGCNRQVSKWGEIHWLQIQKDGASTSSLKDRGGHLPAEKGIFIQLGAGGGGLTQGPSQRPM